MPGPSQRSLEGTRARWAALLTDHREQQQGTADGDGHDDGGLAAPQLQRGDGLVEVPYLDLRGCGEGGVASPDIGPALLLTGCVPWSKSPDLSEPRMPPV